MKKVYFSAILLIGLFFSLNSHSVMITGAFTGAWYNVDEPGQGLMVQTIENSEGPQVMVIWFTFDSEGNQNWLMGLSPYDGNEVTVNLAVFSGGIFDTQGFDNSEIVQEEWGSLTLTFQNCNKGSAVYESNDSNIGSGGFTIKRLTKTKGTNCSGGTSDDAVNAPSEDVQLDFVNSGEDEDASGRLKFERNSEFDQLKLWYKDLPEGDYDLVVDGEVVGQLYAKSKGQSHQFYSSPVHDNWELLDFEVLGKLVEISQEGTVFLSVEVPGQSEE